MKKILSIFLVALTVFSLPFYASAADETSDDRGLFIEVAEGCSEQEDEAVWRDDFGKEIVLIEEQQPEGLSISSTAPMARASYPMMILDYDESDLTIMQGDKGKLKFTILREFNNEKYHVEFYNSNNVMVASASGSVFSTSSIAYTTINFDTKNLNMAPGTYKIRYYMEFYSLYEWHTAPNAYTATLKVLANTCNGNHAYTTSVYTKATCENEGKNKQTCSRCGYITYSSIPKTDHTYEYSVEKEPTCINKGEGMNKCKVCGTKTYTEIPANGHSFGSFISNGDGTVTGVCSKCGDIKTINEVYRIKGKTRYETSIAIANETKAKTGVDKFNTIIIASGTNFADALAGSYLAAVKNAPILMSSGTNDAQLKQYISANLASGGQIYILGGTAAVPQSTEDALSGYNVKRLKGKTRYDTNIEILKEAGVTNQDILVATGTNFADSLSASAVGKPILLVDGKGGLSQAQKNYLNSLTTDNLYILGGTGAVGANYESELAVYGSVERIKGASRHETSVEIAKKFFTNPTSAVVADAWNFPDGLCGGPLANTMNAPLILTKSGSYSAAKGYMQANGINSGAVLGGTARIDDASAKAIFGAEEIIVK